MVVYVDQAMWAWQGLKWCHLLADDLDDLHRFAASLGIKFLLRGVEKVRAEWAMICTTHNLLKLFTLAKAA
jgi:Protein of unknown function (DUF4031)